MNKPWWKKVEKNVYQTDGSIVITTILTTVPYELGFGKRAEVEIVKDGVVIRRNAFTYGSEGAAKRFLTIEIKGSAVGQSREAHRAMGLCMYCSSPTRKNALVIDGDFAHPKCHEKAVRS